MKQCSFVFDDLIDSVMLWMNCVSVHAYLSDNGKWLYENTKIATLGQIQLRLFMYPNADDV